MGVDYYNILQLTRSATDADIKKSYRKLLLKCHPNKNPEDQVAADKFKQVAEAYDVLSDLRKQAVYDQFGKEGLKAGIPKGSVDTGAWTQGYTFHGNADKVFRDFFGGDNPIQNIVFIIKDKQHTRFRRDGINLIHTAKVPLGKALTGGTVDSFTLDDRMLHIPINDIIKPGYTKTVPKNEGMPLTSDPTLKGDLVIEFETQFPQTLTPDKKDLVQTGTFEINARAFLSLDLWES